MTLKVVQDTSTNWTNAEWRVIDRMKKNYLEMDEKSGRPWKLGDDLLEIAPVGPPSVHNPERTQRCKDAALEVGILPGTLAGYGSVAEAWPPSTRVEEVGYSVFRALAGEPDRVAILRRLVKEYGAEGITYGDARREVGGLDRPIGLRDRVLSFTKQIDRFANQRLYAADRLALEQLRLKIDILLGDADEEAV